MVTVLYDSKTLEIELDTGFHQEYQSKFPYLQLFKPKVLVHTYTVEQLKGKIVANTNIRRWSFHSWWWKEVGRPYLDRMGDKGYNRVGKIHICTQKKHENFAGNLHRSKLLNLEPFRDIISQNGSHSQSKKLLGKTWIDLKTKKFE